MIELLKILFFSFLFTSFVFLPYYRIIISKNVISSLNLIDKNVLNILILGNFVLILSFFDIKILDITKLFYLLTLIALFFFLEGLQKFKKRLLLLFNFFCSFNFFSHN